MERGRNLIPRSFMQFPMSLSDVWGNMEDGMNQMARWMSGGESGIDVSEDDKNVYVQAQVPGLSPEDIDIQLDRNTLWIKGEKQEEEENKDKRYHRRARSSFFYQVNLPAMVEEGSEQAEYQNGVLSIIFRKANQKNVKKISIQSGGGQRSQQTQKNQQSQKNQQNKK